MLALALTLGFYILAIGVGLGLLLVPALEWNYAHRIDVRLVLPAVIAAFAILASIVPRRARMDPPGPAVTAGDQPELFEEIGIVAGAAGQAMPADVYIVPDVNAGVARTGGVLGIRSRSILLVGLPLMAVLTRAQLRAVLAHEFGHYYGGDTKIGPLIYRTREAISRTIESLAASGRVLVRLPFLWYGRLFLRITQAVSRRQEFAADGLGARLVGASSMAEGLRSVHRAAPAWEPFLGQELGPLVMAGLLPPLAQGFRNYLRAPRVVQGVEHSLRDLEGRARNPYDSHPPLPERLRALQASADDGVTLLAEGRLATDSGTPADDASAIDLLRDLADLERRLMEGMGPPLGLEAVSWETGPQDAYPILWRRQISSAGTTLAGMTIGSIGEHLEEPFAGRTTLIPYEMLAAAAALGLLERGWSLRTSFGEPILFARRETTLDLFADMDRLIHRQMSAAEWAMLCRAHDIHDVALAPSDPPCSDEPEPNAPKSPRPHQSGSA